MPSLYLSSHATIADNNGLCVGSWAKQSMPGFAVCNWCQCTVNFKAGSHKLTVHSETGKHISNKPKDIDKTIQLTLEESISDAAGVKSKELEVKNKARELELGLVQMFSCHRIPLEAMDCLQEILKNTLGENEIVAKMQLSHSKATYLLKNAVSPVYFQQTVEMLCECDAFVVAFDESEINKRSELELMVKLSHEEYGIQLRHYQTIELEDGAAVTICDAILDSFTDEGIDYKKRLISAMSDGCNVNEGHLGGVKKLMAEKVPGLKDIGSCNDHHVGNAFKYAVLAFDNDCHEALVDIFQDLGGVKGKGLKKKKAFEAACAMKSLKLSNFKKLCTTRFRSYVIALKPVLVNWFGILHYYRTAKNLTNRQIRLKSFFVERELMTKLKLNFIWSTSRYMVETLDFFEKRKVQIHLLYIKMKEVLANCLKRFVQPEVVECMDDEGNLSLKPAQELLEADLSKTLGRKKVFIGDMCSKIIKAMGLTPNSSQLDWFFEKVFIFHKTVVVYLQKYFKKGLLSTDLRYLTALDPKSRSKYQTPHMLKFLMKSFSKVVSNICPDGVDAISSEIDTYSTDIDIGKIDDNLGYEDYWNEVKNLRMGEWKKYDILPRFALAIGTFFNSNSETERSFSVETDINRDPKKNRMNQDTLEAHMQVHFGVESSLNYDKKACVSCNSGRKRSHCHCSKAKISEEMLNRSKKAWEKNPSKETDDKLTVIANESEELLNEELKRIENFKQKLKDTRTFYTSNFMTDVYEKQDKKKKKGGKSAANDKNAEKVKPGKSAANKNAEKVKPGKSSANDKNAEKVRPGKRKSVAGEKVKPGKSVANGKNPEKVKRTSEKKSSSSAILSRAYRIPKISEAVNLEKAGSKSTEPAKKKMKKKNDVDESSSTSSSSSDGSSSDSSDSSS